ncbi:LapA family protein [Actinotalea sp. M2MS4P-6]|uniref:LapA family protein n=1 Tax=Actinotalea sp. M2MS4P-6 TaxID=2983762 RepID=UPI0021E3785B|nr:LapA family protein [Actinotalea sp. M2MS4P-6]MCV2393895.1 LapA family protein [Actinotalea sp. M2MS4P-6]
MADTSGKQESSVTPRRVLAVVLAALAVVFMIQNSERVTVNVFGIEVTTWLWLVLAVMTAIGIGVGLLLARRKKG